MRVRLGTIEIDDERRRLLNKARGMKGLASREDVRALAHSGIDQLFIDMCYDAELEGDDDEV